LPFDLTQGQRSQIWPFLIAFGLEIWVWLFGSFLAFLGKFDLEDFSLALVLFLALFWPFLH